MFRRIYVFFGDSIYLVEVDDWLPEVVLLLVEISHTNLSEVTWMVLVHVGTVMMLTSSKTTSTGILAVLADTSVTGGNMSAAVKNVSTVYDKILTRLKLRPGAHPLPQQLHAVHFHVLAQLL